MSNPIQHYLKCNQTSPKKNLKIGIYVSSDVVCELPLYCRNLDVAQRRIENLCVRAGHHVVHNKVYAPMQLMYSGEVDLIILVCTFEPTRLIELMPHPTLIISPIGGDIDLYDAVRCRSMFALAEVLKSGRWKSNKTAALRYIDSEMSFESACDIAIQQGWVKQQNDFLRLVRN